MDDAAMGGAVGTDRRQREADLWCALQTDLSVVTAAMAGLSGLVGDSQNGACSDYELSALLRCVADRAATAEERAAALYRL